MPTLTEFGPAGVVRRLLADQGEQVGQVYDGNRVFNVAVILDPALRKSVAEVGALAAAFDRYQQRLDAFLRREREFTADACHELRSPLSVLQAGLDVLAEEADISPSGQRAMQRMHRRAAELTDLLDALLYLDRNEHEPMVGAEPIPLLAAWQRLGADRVLAEAAAAVHVEGDANAVVVAPERVAALVFGQLLRLFAEQTDGESLRIQVHSNRIELGHGPIFPMRRVIKRGKPAPTVLWAHLASPLVRTSALAVAIARVQTRRTRARVHILTKMHWQPETSARLASNL